MTRKKVKLEWIVNDTARKASLKKRRLGLLKKVSELIILCGVEAFIIIYSPDEAEPMIWPPSRADVERLIMRYMSMPEMERMKKLTNQETYFKERIGKVQEQGKKSHQKNEDSEFSFLMSNAHEGNGLDDFQTFQLYGLNSHVTDKMKNLRKRIEYFQMLPPVEEQHHASENVDVGGDEGATLQDQMIQNPHEPMSWDQWFLDMVHDSIGEGSQMGFQNAPQRFEPYGHVDMAHDQLHGNVGPAGLTMYPPQTNVGGDGFPRNPYADDMTARNPFGLGFPPLTLPPPYHSSSRGGRNDGVNMGMHGFYGGGGSGGRDDGVNSGMHGFYGGGGSGGRDDGVNIGMHELYGGGGGSGGRDDGVNSGMHGFYGGGGSGGRDDGVNIGMHELYGGGGGSGGRDDGVNIGMHELYGGGGGSGGRDDGVNIAMHGLYGGGGGSGVRDDRVNIGMHGLYGGGGGGIGGRDDGVNIGMHGLYGGGGSGGRDDGVNIGMHGLNGGGGSGGRDDGVNIGMHGLYGGEGSGGNDDGLNIGMHGLYGGGGMGGRADGVNIGMHGFYGEGSGGGGGDVGDGPSASAGSVRPHGDGESDQMGVPNYQVTNPNWPNNPEVNNPHWPNNP